VNTFSSLVLTARQLKGDGSTRSPPMVAYGKLSRQGVSRNKARVAEAARGVIQFERRTVAESEIEKGVCMPHTNVSSDMDRQKQDPKPICITTGHVTIGAIAIGALLALYALMLYMRFGH
jgi:hypothetical protein